MATRRAMGGQNVVVRKPLSYTGNALPNTATVTKVYDNANRLTSVTNKNSGGTTLSSFTYAYRTDDLRSSCTESNGDVVSYTYDGAHRMTAESRTGTNAYGTCQYI